MPSSCASVAPALWKTRPSPSSRMPGSPSAKKCASDCGIDAFSASIDMRSRPLPAKIAAGSMPKDTLSLAGSARRLPSSATSQSTLARLAGCTSSRMWMRLKRHVVQRDRQRFRLRGQPVAERVRRALEDQRQAGRALVDVFQRLPVGAVRIGIVDALGDDPRRQRIGPHGARRCVAARAASADRCGCRRRCARRARPRRRRRRAPFRQAHASARARTRGTAPPGEGRRPSLFLLMPPHSLAAPRTLRIRWPCDNPMPASWTCSCRH